MLLYNERQNPIRIEGATKKKGDVKRGIIFLPPFCHFRTFVWTKDLVVLHQTVIIHSRQGEGGMSQTFKRDIVSIKATVAVTDNLSMFSAYGLMPLNHQVAERGRIYHHSTRQRAVKTRISVGVSL